MRVLTYGATGVQGGPVARRLLEAGHEVRAVVRDPGKAAWLEEAGAELTAADLADRDKLLAATRGIDAVFFHLPLVFDMDDGLGYARNAVDAAREAGVDLLVVNSSGIPPAEPSGYLHLDIKREVDAHIRKTGIPTISLQPSVYMEVLEGTDVRMGIADHGLVCYPLPESHRISWMSVEDIAALSVAAFERPDLAGSSFKVGGPEALTGDQLAEKFSSVLGRPIAYRAVSNPEYADLLRSSAGEIVSHVIADHLIHIEEAGVDYLAADDAVAVADELGVQLTRLEDWVAARDWTVTSVA